MLQVSTTWRHLTLPFCGVMEEEVLWAVIDAHNSNVAKLMSEPPMLGLKRREDSPTPPLLVEGCGVCSGLRRLPAPSRRLVRSLH